MTMNQSLKTLAPLRLLLTCAAVLLLETGTAAADGLAKPTICGRQHLDEATRAWCDGIAGSTGRALYKATVLDALRRTNRPPVADLKPSSIMPGRVDLDASGSTDSDGFPEHYTFALFDADTGESIAGPVTNREPFASLQIPAGSPPRKMRASVIVEDDERATGTADLAVTAAQTNCSGQVAFFNCSLITGGTACTVVSSITEFTTTELLDAAQGCDVNIDENTPVVITAAGGSGGGGASIWPYNGGGGGSGGTALMATNVAYLDSTYGSPSAGTTYCYGIGKSGGHGDTHSGAGGASTLLRTCQNVSQTDLARVLLIAGGGGGGGAAGLGASGHGGGGGGNTAGGNAGGGQGGGSGGFGGSGGKGGAAAPAIGGPSGNDGVGGKGGNAEDWGTAGFIQGNPQVSGSSGQGGAQDNTGGGAGGGGYGGGGAGALESAGLGGGGGGSFAAKSIYAISSTGGNSGDGYLQFAFYP
jgi:hypothetical protein